MSSAGTIATWAGRSEEEQRRDAAARYEITSPPAVARVRFVSAKERPALLVQCLHDAGWPQVRLKEDNTWETGDITGDQANAFQRIPAGWRGQSRAASGWRSPR